MAVWYTPNMVKRISVSAAVLAGLTLGGCAQTNAVFDGTTGTLSRASQTTGSAAAGMPPLPSRRKAQDARPAGEGDLFAALSDIDLTAEAVGPRSVVADDQPVNVYVRLARLIRRCWLGPDDPRLPGHGFRAKAKPGRNSGAEIDVYKKAPGRKYGPYAYEVKITPEGRGSLVRSTNRRVDAKLANTLRADVARWVRGGTGCHAPDRGNA